MHVGVAHGRRIVGGEQLEIVLELFVVGDVLGFARRIDAEERPCATVEQQRPCAACADRTASKIARLVDECAARATTEGARLHADHSNEIADALTGGVKVHVPTGQARRLRRSPTGCSGQRDAAAACG
jgi:hypothetical protein